MSSRAKKVILGILILGLAVAGAAFIGSKEAPSPTGTLVSNRIDGPIGSNNSSISMNDQFFSTLLGIQNINIDTSLFKNPAYLYLKDHPVTLGNEAVGRQNPFAPVGTDQTTTPDSVFVPVVNQQQQGQQPVPQQESEAVRPASGTGVETLQPGKIKATTAEFGATVNFPAETGPAVLVFTYGTNSTMSETTESLILENGGVNTVSVAGLKPATKYYVQATLVYGTQTLKGSVMAFTTAR